MNDPHPQSEELGYLSADDVLQRLEAGGITSLDLVVTLIERMKELDDPKSTTALTSITALSADARFIARERDDERGAGRLRGPLHGVPVVIKDSVEAKGLPGLAGSTALIGRPTRDATLVTRLREAGAVVLASTNMSEWANSRSRRSTSGYSATAGLVANPWALDRSAGGSSSGSGAALAAGFAPLAVGTETDASIVLPASVNGVVGLKPTVGRVPTTHVVPISASQDSPGPMARTVDDVALMFAVLAHCVPETITSAPSIAVAKNWRTGHPKTDQLFDDLVREIEASGVTVTARDVASPGEAEGRDEGTVLMSEMVDDLSAYLEGRPGDGVHSLADVITFEDEHADVEQIWFGHENFVFAVASGGRANAEYADARRRNLNWAFETCLKPGLEGVDVLLAPAYGPSWKSDLTIGGLPGPSSHAATPSAIAGWPILSMPMGIVDGLPVGLAIVGRAASEWSILEAARRIERIIHSASPPPRPSWSAPARG
jgi:amidase